MNQMVPKSSFEKQAYTMTERLADVFGLGPRAEAIRHLSAMDEHLLRDIGVSRGDIKDAASGNLIR
jgi:hypothetical protein